MLTRNRAYEVHKGETKKLFDTWMEKYKKLIKYRGIMDKMYNDE